jgi:hypothetical protein
VADSNAFVLPVAIPDSATPAQRRRALDHARDTALRLKRRELRRGKGVDGRPLKPVQPASRPDGAKGPPLSPHQAESRSQRWLRATIGAKAGTVTLWWSHGWGRILGYHARGEVRGAPVRDVIGLTAADRRAFDAELARWWKLQGPRPRPRPLPPPVFVPSERSKRAGHLTVTADVARLEKGAARDTGYHVGPGGSGAGIPGRYAEAKRFIAEARRTRTPILQPEVTVDADGTVSFSDGRHRFAALRDAGVKQVAVSVPRDQVSRAARTFGVGVPVVPKVITPKPVAPRPVAPRPIVPKLPAAAPPFTVTYQTREGPRTLPAGGEFPKKGQGQKNRLVVTGKDRKK